MMPRYLNAKTPVLGTITVTVIAPLVLLGLYVRLS